MEHGLFMFTVMEKLTSSPKREMRKGMYFHGNSLILLMLEETLIDTTQS